MKFGWVEGADQRHVIEHIEAAALGGENHVVVALLKGDIGDWRFREVELEGQPLFTVVVRDVEVRLGAGEEKAFLIRIRSDGAGEVVGRNAVDDFLPALAVVGRLPEEGMEVVSEIHGSRDVGSAGIEGRRGNAVDANPLGRVLGRDVLPGFAVVRGEVDETVV